MWPFKKKPTPVHDARNWNDDWQVGDTAECVISANGWHPETKPWERPAKGTQLIVTGFSELTLHNILAYVLHFEDGSYGTCTAWRKVRLVKRAEETSVGAKIRHYVGVTGTPETARD